MQLEVSSVPLEGRFAQPAGRKLTKHRSAAGERSTCHGGGTPMQGSIFSKKDLENDGFIDDIKSDSNLFLCLLCFSFVYMVV